MYMLRDDGCVYLARGEDDEPDMPWLVRFTPFYETLQGRKVYSKILLRLELPQGSFVAVRIRLDDGLWQEAAKVTGGKNDVVSVSLPLARCDKFEIMLEGEGACAVLGMLREFRVGSEV